MLSPEHTSPMVNGHGGPFPFARISSRGFTGASAFLLGPALIVFLIGCVNVSCMLLGRGIERDVELSVRTALGASRARILRQLMTEHLLLAGIAGFLGCGLAVGILKIISARLAAFPAATGVFGVLTQSVAQRTTEFGVRMAMGASPGAVLAMVVVREAKLIVAAIGAGAIGTVMVTRGLFAELVTVNATDARMWIMVAALCGGFAAAAVMLATRRIVRLDPWTVLRNG